MRRVMTIGAAAAAMLAAQPAFAAAFVNGDFELPGQQSIRNQILDGAAPAPIAGGFALTGWGHAGGSFDIYQSNTDDIAAQSGTHYVSFGHSGSAGGSIFQTFDVTAGLLYTINYYVGEQQGDDPGQVLRAILANGSETISRDNTALALGFRLGAPISFVAQGSSATITFFDATTNGGFPSNIALDSVSVTAATTPVPEPASWAMMIAGVGLMGGALRRRSAQVRLAA